MKNVSVKSECGYIFPLTVIMLSILVQLESKGNLMNFKYKTEKNNRYELHEQPEYAY